jgi:nucleotide-binding universal stress UspA family protein
VAVAPAGFSGDRLQLIGVAFVGRPDGRAALGHGCDLARAAGALVRILTVREPSEWRYSPLEPSQLAAIERARDEATERAMNAGLAAVPESQSAGGEVLSGPPHRALAAASADLDLLICGSRGHGPAKTLLLGGVSHVLVRRAACPVLVVPVAETAAAETSDGATRAWRGPADDDPSQDRRRHRRVEPRRARPRVRSRARVRSGPGSCSSTPTVPPRIVPAHARCSMPVFARRGGGRRDGRRRALRDRRRADPRAPQRRQTSAMPHSPYWGFALMMGLDNAFG